MPTRAAAAIPRAPESCSHAKKAEDTYDLVQWIADQPWCDGNVVMLGVSYLAISQYAVAALQPPALRAICPWDHADEAGDDDDEIPEDEQIVRSNNGAN